MTVSRKVLEAVVADFRRRKAPKRERERAWIAELPTLADVIRAAGMATNSRGKRDSHHGRRKTATLGECTRILLENEDNLRRSKDFDDVHAWIDKLLEEVHDVNKLYYYDTAVHIAMKLGLEPDKVYLHSGAADGARALLDLHKKAKTVLPREFPPPLCDLKADELEDLLCIYKECFRRNCPPEEAEKFSCLPLEEDEDLIV